MRFDAMLGNVPKRDHARRADSLSGLAAELISRRDGLLTACAALQLMPENATKWMRFERLLEVAAALPREVTQDPIGSVQLRMLLTHPPIATPHVVSQEDPFEEPFTAAITFYGGTYRVIIGGASGANTGCQLVLEAAHLLRRDELRELRVAVMRDARVLLTLSEEMCSRRGLTRWAAATRSPHSPLVVPSDEELSRLARCATFTDAQLEAALGPLSTDVSSLTAPGPLEIVEHDNESPTDDRSYLFPLAELSGGDTLLAFPSGVAASIIHRALARATEHGVAGPMVAALHEAHMQASRRYLDRVRWNRMSPPAGLEDPRRFREDFYRFDVDKVAHVVGIVDSLESYRAGRPFASMDLDAIQAELHERFVEVRAALRARGTGSVLHIIVSAPLGRSFSMGFTQGATDEQSELLVLTTDDLDLLTRLEAPEPLGLWRFARAVGRLHASTRVISFSALDDYAIYRENDSSFYLSDDRPPTGVSIAPGSGGVLRAEERQRIDEHGARLPRSDAVVEVSRWSADDAAPIYRPNDPAISAYRLVELGAPCWIVPAPDSESELEMSEDLAEAVAFWLWRCAEHLQPALARLRDVGVVIDARFVTPDLSEPNVSNIEPASAWLDCAVAEDQSGVRLTLLDGAAHRLAGANNDGERALAGALVATLSALAGIENAPSPMDIAASLPAGPMRMLHVFGDADDVLFRFGYTGRPRLISASDSELLLDEVGALASRLTGMAIGEIPAADRTEVLNGIVAALFDDLRQRLSSLDSADLLEYLVAEQEALILSEARTRLLIPAQAACFGEDSSAVREAIASSRDHTYTSIANRFLLEFATAISPSGSERLSIALYDELIALALEIAELGYLSDAIRYELSATRLSVLPSGRLGISRDDPYHQAVTAYAGRVAGSALDLARSVFASHWRGSTSADVPFDPTALNEAFEAEFGVSAAELAQVQGDLMELARNEQRQIAVRKHGELVAELASLSSWPTSRIELALDLMMLGPLSEFPPMRNRKDSFPWRFARDRSAIRRPLLCRLGRDGIEVVWGPRSVYRAGHYLLDLVHTRLEPQSDAMKRYVTTLRQEANLAFQREVAALYRTVVPDVRENVKRIGKLRLARSNNEDIGDIDVFVLDERNKVMVAVEVKDFEFARTPVELAGEMTKLLVGDKSAAHHHAERLAFLKRHRAEVHAALGLSGAEREWQIHGQVVTSHDLLAAQFPIARTLAKQLNILHIGELVDLAAAGRLTRRTPDSTALRRRRRRKGR